MSGSVIEQPKAIISAVLAALGAPRPGWRRPGDHAGCPAPGAGPAPPRWALAGGPEAAGRAASGPAEAPRPRWGWDRCAASARTSSPRRATDPRSRGAP